MGLSETIKKIRQTLCLEQDEFAKLIGVSKGSICHYEKGQRQPRMPILREIIALAKKHKIQISTEDFFK